MQTIKLQASVREKTGKEYAKFLRREGKVPAVLYGKEADNILIEVNRRDVEKIIDSKLGVNTLIHLEGDKLGKDVMIKEFQGHAITRDVRHVDFILVREGQEIHVQVPVHLVGKAKGQVEGGIVDQVSRHLDLICKPGHIPEFVEADITELALGQSLHLADIQLPQGTQVSPDYNPTLVTISIPRAEEEAKPAEADAAAATPAEGEKAAEKKDEKKPEEKK